MDDIDDLHNDGAYIEFYDWPSGEGRGGIIGNNAGKMIEISASSKPEVKQDIYIATYARRGEKNRRIEDNGFWAREDFVDMILIMFPELRRA